MIRLRNLHKKLRNEPLLNRAELHFTKMNGVAAYAGYQQDTTRLGGMLPDFRTAIINTKLGGKDRTIIKNKFEVDIITLLNGISKGIEFETRDMPIVDAKAFATRAGFEVVEPKAPVVRKVVDYIDAPSDFTVTDEKKVGAALFKYIDSNDAITNMIEELIDGVHWQFTSCAETSPIVLTGFTPKAMHTFRIRSFANGTVSSDCSDPVTVWIS